MHHPRSRAERRQNRVTITVRRRKMIRRSCTPEEIRRGWRSEENYAWYSCAKWNLDCTCGLCKLNRQHFNRRRRRDQLKFDVIENRCTWGLEQIGRAARRNAGNVYVH
jgi:hypothetical protein